MRSLVSRFGQPLLVAGLSSCATLALCILYVQTQGPAGSVFGVPASVVTPTAMRPLPPTSQTQSILPKNGLEPRLLEQQKQTSGVQDEWDCEAITIVDDQMVSLLLRRVECRLHQAIFAVVGGSLTCFIFAIIMVVVWHVVFLWKRHKLSHFKREISLGIITLNLFYNEKLPNWIQTNPFTASSCLLCLEAALFRIEEWRDYQKDVEDDPQQNVDLSDLVAYDRYAAMSTPIITVFFLFVSQFSLGLFYSYALNNQKHGWYNSSGWRWFIGLIICNMVGEEEIGNVFSFPFWLKVLKTKNKKMQRTSRHLFCIHIKYKHEAFIRMVMSMFVNMFIRRIIVSTGPILLSVVVDPIDFIKDVLALFFITKLDELSNAVTFEKDLDEKHRKNERIKGFLLLRDADDTAEDMRGDTLVTEDRMKEVADQLERKMLDVLEQRMAELQKKP